MEAYKPITHFIKEQGAIPGIQISHAGRKASVCVPREGGKGVEVMQGGWPVIGPSELPFSKDTQKPHAMSETEIGEVVQSVKRAAERSLIAGYPVMEIHAAHGYLFHEFLSPLSNRRTVRYGGSLENRMRLTLEVADAVRQFRTSPQRTRACLKTVNKLAKRNCGRGLKFIP